MCCITAQAKEEEILSRPVSSKADVETATEGKSSPTKGIGLGKFSHHCCRLSLIVWGTIERSSLARYFLETYVVKECAHHILALNILCALEP